MDREKIEGIRNAKLTDLLKIARTEDDLREIARARGYKPAWVRHVLASKERAHDRYTKGAARNASLRDYAARLRAMGA
jgi:hypothetical protein